MKIITLFGGKEFLIDEEELPTVLGNLEKKIIKLRNDDYIAPSAIQSISNVPMVAYYKGYAVLKDGKSYLRDGDRITISEPNLIEYQEDPSYYSKFYAQQAESERLKLK